MGGIGEQKKVTANLKLASNWLTARTQSTSVSLTMCGSDIPPMINDVRDICLVNKSVSHTEYQQDIKP